MTDVQVNGTRIVDAAILAEIEASVDFAKASAFPSLTAAEEDVFAD